jgi:hypothetical protein
MFSIETFLNTELTGENATKRLTLPPGAYPGVITDVGGRQFEGKKDSNRGQVYNRFDVTVELHLPPEVVTAIGASESTVKRTYGIMLDVTSSGALDMAKDKNTAFGRLREAAGMNSPDKPFLPRALVGLMLSWTVVNKPSISNPAEMIDEISAVTKM